MSQTFHFRCPSCGADRAASKKIIGRRVTCPECNSVHLVPDPREIETERTSTAGLETQSSGEKFDPYYHWLAIPPTEQPPNHYRLLGVALFEPDANVIAVSADRQMVHVKAQSTGKYVRQSQQLLNELARARACLLDSKKRAEYDVQLRNELKARTLVTRPPGGAATTKKASATKPRTISRPLPGSNESGSLGPTALPASKPPDRSVAGRKAAANEPSRTSRSSSAEQKSAPVRQRAAAPHQSPVSVQNRRSAGQRPATAVPAPSARPQKRWKAKPVIDTEPLEPEAVEPVVSFRAERGDFEAEMDMTPMVDVTFLLLIFFMVTAAFSMQKSMEMPASRQDEPSTNVQTIEDFQDDPNFVVVQIDAYNTYHVLTTDWEEEAPSEHELLIRLRRARQGNRNRQIPTKLLVSAHGDALYEKVIAAMDAGTSVGMTEVQVVTTEEEFD